MNFKEGVYTKATVIRDGTENSLVPSTEIQVAWTICDEVSKELTGKSIVITSILDGKHKDGSKHYTGDAFDARSFIYTKEQQAKLLEEFRKRLGPDYTVLLESDHFHIQFNRKL